MFALEKRGYVKAGPWTPEATVTHPEAGKTGQVNHRGKVQTLKHAGLPF